ncbi:MAG: hypothetical protein WD490_09185 [Opitutales bacterium]
MDKPLHALAKRITDRLVKEGLFTEPAGKKAQALIASGKMTQEDWRLPIELATEKTEEEHP